MSGVRMLHQLCMAIVFAGAIGAVGVVSAQPGQPVTPPTTQQPTTPATPSGQDTTTGAASGQQQPGLDPNRRVCRSQETLGSRLRKRTVCRTAAEWDQLDAQARQDGKDMTDRNNINYTDPKMGGG